MCWFYTRPCTCNAAHQQRFEFDPYCRSVSELDLIPCQESKTHCIHSLWRSSNLPKITIPCWKNCLITVIFLFVLFPLHIKNSNHSTESSNSLRSLKMISNPVLTPGILIVVGLIYFRNITDLLTYLCRVLRLINNVCYTRRVKAMGQFPCFTYTPTCERLKIQDARPLKCWCYF